MNHVFTNPGWVDFDRRAAFYRFWRRVAFVVIGALAITAVSIVLSAGTQQ